MLFTFAGGAGHFLPLTPLARAVQAAGHTVAFGGQARLVPMVEEAGFTAFDTGGRTFADDEVRRPLLELDMEREYRAVREGYAGRIARPRAEALIKLSTEWRPDLIVCDEMDFGAMVAAERLGVPHASMQVIATGAMTHRARVGEALDALRGLHGLAPDPELAMLNRWLTISPFPPSLRDPKTPAPSRICKIAPVSLEDVQEAGWLAELPARPTVYLTLGTVFNVESGDLFARLIEGLAALPINLIVTTGPQISAEELGRQPPNVRIERFIDQWALLPHCDLVVSHAGSGTVVGALAHGLPMVLLPMGADQLLNADRCVALGVARVLDPVAATAGEAKAAVAAMLADEPARRAAGRLHDEIADLPPLSLAVEQLEALMT
jgi:UDP:flavonoid glycosyltransferase YjiC (YdhE family)